MARRGGPTRWSLLALAVVANDVGAYFLGSAFGRTPLRAWISPGKSVEGFLGGTILTMLVMVIVSIQGTFDTWSQTSDLLFFGLVVSVLAPLGDLTESMFKRNLDVKDFGSIVKGHGGVLDRFDGFLFTLPGVYYLIPGVDPVRRIRSELTNCHDDGPGRDRRIDRVDRYPDDRVSFGQRTRGSQAPMRWLP